jgi:hypothetical protein
MPFAFSNSAYMIVRHCSPDVDLAAFFLKERMMRSTFSSVQNTGSYVS